MTRFEAMLWAALARSNHAKAEYTDPRTSAARKAELHAQLTELFIALTRLEHELRP